MQNVCVHTLLVNIWEWDFASVQIEQRSWEVEEWGVGDGLIGEDNKEEVITS